MSTTTAACREWDAGVQYGCTNQSGSSSSSVGTGGGRDATKEAGQQQRQGQEKEEEEGKQKDVIYGGLSGLYHCRYCVALRHPDQLAHEIEVYYATSNLREYKLANDARAKRCRSSDSYACPLCACPLQMTRQSHTGAADDEDAGDEESEDPATSPASSSKEQCLVLCCSYCQWTSTGTPFVGSESTIAQRVTEAMQAKTHDRFNELLGHFKGVVAEDMRLEQHQKHYIAAMNYRKTRVYHMHPVKKLPSKAQLLSAVRDRMGKRYDITKGEWVAPPKLQTWGDLSPRTGVSAAAPAADEFTNSDLSRVSSLSQRFENLNTQPHFSRDLHPVFERFTAKTSLRCRVCQHNVVRPELAPDSYKFKIAQFASNHVPRVVVVQRPDFTSASPKVVLEIENPRDYVVNISFSLPAAGASAAAVGADEAVAAHGEDQSAGGDGNGSQPLQQLVEVVAPEKPVPVPQYEPLRSADDEFAFEDDPPCVVRRALSGAVRVALPLRVNGTLPDADEDKEGQEEATDGTAQTSIHTIVHMHYQHHIVQLKARAQGSGESSVVSVVTPLRIALRP